MKVIATFLAASAMAAPNWVDTQDPMYPTSFNEKMELAPIPDKNDARNLTITPFKIVNEASGMALTYKHNSYNSPEAGALDVSPSGSNQHQLWLLDSDTGAIKSFMNDTFVLTMTNLDNVDYSHLPEANDCSTTKCFIQGQICPKEKSQSQKQMQCCSGEWQEKSSECLVGDQRTVTAEPLQEHPDGKVQQFWFRPESKLLTNIEFAGPAYCLMYNNATGSPPFSKECGENYATPTKDTVIPHQMQWKLEWSA